MTAKSYLVLDEPAVHVALPGGNSITAERYRGYYSVSWTTNLDGRVALAALRTVIPAGDDVEYDFGGAVQIDEREAVPDLPLDCAEFSLAYSRATLSWDFDGTGHRPEITVLSPELSEPEVRRLMCITATGRVRESLDRDLRRFSFLWTSDLDSDDLP